MKKDKTPNKFIKPPEYPGGTEALKKFIGKNLKYPAEAAKNKIEGTVYVAYRLGFDGKVVEVEILKPLGYGCDEEAARLVKMLEYQPQKNRKLRVASSHKIKIHFRLPKPEPKPKVITKRPVGQQKVAYHYTSNKKKTNVYTYTVNKN